MTNNIAATAANNIRVLTAAMVEKARSGHPGGAMGAADFIHILYTEFLNFDPSDMAWPNRDRFFLDPGHMSPMLYAVLYLFGIYSQDDLEHFRQWGSKTPGHPELDVSHGIENTSGPLGLGHAMAVGAALAERHLTTRFGRWMEHKIYTLISDGGIQEEISQGAGRIAGFLGLNNLIMFYDSNDVQLSTNTSVVSGEETARKYEAWGWSVTTIDGNDPDQIRSVLHAAINEKNRPSLIIGKTIMAKGALTDQGAKYEGHVSTHGQPLSKAGVSFERTIRTLGGDPEHPFRIFPDVMELYLNVRQEKIRAAASRKQEQVLWETAHPEAAALYHRFLSGSVSGLDFGSIDMPSDQATRMASGKVLEYLSAHLENMIVISADLSNSDKTEGFLKSRKPLAPHEFSGAFLHAGVSELTMAAIANGILLHGGLMAACGTFLVFSDYMKPAVRMAALMELPVIYIWTHDSFRVGEDGPTHQPVEHEAQIRLLEQLKNHAGGDSLLVLRPADGYETRVAWQMALENRKSPTAILLSRQSVKDLPASGGRTRLEQAQEARKGAYPVFSSGVRPAVILLANGSEVSTLYEVAMKLTQRNIPVRVVSAISEGLFNRQSEAYRQEILPEDTPVFALTAGLPVTLRGMAGLRGKVVGLDHFGHSAPAEILDKKFGFEPEIIFQEVLNFISTH